MTYFRAGTTGCSRCGYAGFREDERGQLYILLNSEKVLLKVGKTNNFVQRRAQQELSGFDVVVDVSPMMPGDAVSRYENEILASLRRRGAVFACDHPDFTSFEGHTEAWLRRSLDIGTVAQLLRMVHDDEP